jgi:hypothetical protein
MLLYGDHLAPKRSERATWYEELTRDVLTLRERHEDTINTLEYAQSVDSIGAQIPGTFVFKNDVAKYVAAVRKLLASEHTTSALV